MIRYLVMILSLVPSIALAKFGDVPGAKKKEYHLLDAITPALALDHFSIDVMKFGCNREFQIPEIACNRWIGRVRSNFDMTLLKHGFWRNQLHAEAAHGKFYTVGWHWELGFRLGSQLELMWEHHSRHTMDVDQTYYTNRMTGEYLQHRYPIEDSYGIKFKLYERNR